MRNINLRDRYIQVRNQSVRLCEPLTVEDFVAQPVVDVSPPKWHLAHTTWFFESLVLKPFLKGYKVFHPHYTYLFNSYYESLGERTMRNHRGAMTRPTVEEIFKYRKSVDGRMLQMLDQGDLAEEITYVIEVGLQHEQQHQELLVTDIKYILGHNPLFPAYTSRKEQSTGTIQKGNFVSIEPGLFDIGYRGHDFFYDNEKGAHQVYLNGFKIMDRLTTNGEYMEFIAAKGYESFEWWLSEGWDWVKENHIKAPLYWRQDEGIWRHYTLNGLEEVNPEEPVTHISYYEASAYALWKGKRLPTEFEWEAAARIFYPEKNPKGNFVESGYFKPTVQSDQSMQMFGDVWEWTGSAYLAYPRYVRVDGALGEYNGKFMVNQMTLRGGSCATPADHIRHTYRNFFHPHLRWQFTGIRLAADL